MRKPRIWLLHRPEFPRPGRGYMPAIPDELRSVSKPTPKIFTVMVPPPNMGYGLFNFGRNLILPPSSFPRYIAGESGTNVHVPTFLKPSRNSSNDRTLNPGRVISVFPENCYHFIIISHIYHIHVVPDVLFNTVMKYCRVWKLEKVNRWYR